MQFSQNLSYEYIINQFISAANASLAISTFDTGTIDFLDANAVNKTYPYVYLRPISSPGVVDNIRTLTFELYSLDVPKLSDESPVDLLSATEQRIYELMAWFNRGTQQQVFEVTMTDLSPVNEAFQDRVFGWVATIEVSTPWMWDFCDYPRILPSPTPSPTATTIPTATPIPTATSTPTPTPSSTPIQPTPTVSPTATPTPTPFVQRFALLEPASLWSDIPGEVCDTTVQNSGSVISVYAVTDNPNQQFPENVYSQRLYTDNALTTPYTQSIAYEGYYSTIIDNQEGEIYQVIMDRFADDNWEARKYSVCSGIVPTATPTPSPTPTNTPTPTPSPTPLVVQFWIQKDAVKWSIQSTAACNNFENLGDIVYAAETNPGEPFPANIKGAVPYTQRDLITQYTNCQGSPNEWAPIWQTDEVYIVKVGAAPGCLISFQDVDAIDCNITIPQPTAIPPTATPIPTLPPEWFTFIGQPVSASFQSSSFVGDCDNVKDEVKDYWVYGAPTQGQFYCRITGSTGQIYNSPNLNDPVAVQSPDQQVKYLYIDGPQDPPGDDWSHQYKLVQATGSYNWYIHSIYGCDNTEIDC